MHFNNAELLNYAARIKFSNEDKTKYQNQIDNLISSLSDCIKNNSNTKVTKVIQAGSWKKGTILKPDNDNPVDIDLVFFLDIGREDSSTLDEINELLVEFLKLVYPTKNNEDFWDNPKTAGIEFLSSGLNVDIVPVKQIDNSDYVEQPDKNMKTYKTSPKGHIDFISKRKSANPSFSSAVRIIKKWKNLNEVKLSSFAIEMIISYLEITEGVNTNIEDAIVSFFNLIGRKKFPIITFLDGEINAVNSPVYIADPTNNENNIAEYVSGNEWKSIRDSGNKSFETIMFARELEGKATTLELWKEIFVDSFNISNLE